MAREAQGSLFFEFESSVRSVADTVHLAWGRELQYEPILPILSTGITAQSRKNGGPDSFLSI